MNIMRKIDSIIIHCSATKVGQDFLQQQILTVGIVNVDLMV